MTDTQPPTDETEIHQLDEDTVARIAAGEVVERPASAVKELVENSLDAGASSIDVTVEAGGTDLVRVADDGHGMTEADLRAAVRQHTTSKISGLDDLESGVATLGFRGEALHTIGSVSRLTIQSRPQDGDGAGTELVYEGGTVESVSPTGCPAGTTVEVADLFYNTPARRKFLKTTATEFAHVNRVVTRYALANPEVAVSLTHDGREVFSTTGQGDLQAAVLAVYGREVASAMIPVDADGEELPPGPLESVAGLVSHPETNRASREYLATYVNDRAVTSDALREGIMGAYGTQLGGDRYPFVVLFHEVPGDAVDVNVHPRKREVRFDDDDAVRRQVDSAVESALLEHGLLRSRAPRGRSAPGEAQVTPTQEELAERSGAGTETSAAEPSAAEPSTSEGDADESGVLESGDTASGTNEETATSAAGGDRKPTTPDRAEDPKSAESVDATKSQASESTESADAEFQSAAAFRPDDDSTSDISAASSSSPSGVGGQADPDPDTDTETNTDTDSAPDPKPNPESAAASSMETPGATETKDGNSKFDATTEQRTLAGDAATGGDYDHEFDSLPPLRVLGQLSDTYLVCETDDGLALIDQHAADERVNYERLRTAFDEDSSAQALASPVELELTAAEAEAFAAYRDALAQLGFYADRVDDRTVAVTTVPAVFEKTLDPEQLRDVLVSFVEGDREAGAETVDALADEFIGDLACYPSITGNTSLTEGSVVDLLAALDDCENPYACPHGRPVVVQFDEAEIEDRFERDYPGHSG
ncbi:DNA mismatch repair protein MutL [Natrialba magadii ATCC 43099]|uniref:DNA mismatch repair protein MutL n=1 Tax=Natrialba magadii (strain ATCC 43099 / DSM 3394 / CCM 3739 / CIP 104546 / IAM 13178 / JCM 8861 / NBRC 102185 / NCIMB 2190 / MS3) TaxID=547559 RepID=D3SSE3_NATMM|nr:DNA mismatch repair endonuclease MutL [Natrialba magadii]ADD04869.1 DNA mismatch repair protein MutL [Natrialba magadii ATCC 43099]ELY24454.1 DNA mismatch repair protein MutL [Natrialba magadii ATCC 43099]